MATSAPPLPADGPQTPDDHRQVALRFLVHAQEELDKENRLQASEKAWVLLLISSRPSHRSGDKRMIPNTCITACPAI